MYYYSDDYRYYYLLYIDITIYNSTYSINKTTPRNVSRLTFRVNEGHYIKTSFAGQFCLSIIFYERAFHFISRPVYFYFVNSVLLCVFHIVESSQGGRQRCMHARRLRVLHLRLDEHVQRTSGFPVHQMSASLFLRVQQFVRI